jgi:hypothetical protein
MAIRVLPYVTIEVDDRLRRRVRHAADRLRINVRSHLLSAADDVDTAGERVRNLCDAAIDPATRRDAEQGARVEAG